MFTDPLNELLTEAQYESGRSMPRSNCETPGQISMTEVFPAPRTPSSTTAGARGRAYSPHSGSHGRRRASSSVQMAGGIISVSTHDGEELHYPVVQGRAGGSLSPHSHSAESSPSIAMRSSLAARVHRHTSITSRSTSSLSILQGAIDSGGADEGETSADARESYRHSRLTPSSIQRHRRVSGATSRTPPAALALRSEPVEEFAQPSPTQVATPSWSMPSTPRHSIQRTPPSGRRADWLSLAADGVLGRSADVGRSQHTAPEGAPIRVEEMGVSTPEMAEYFAESALDAARRRESSGMLSNSNGASWPLFHEQAAPRRSLPERSSHPASHNDKHAFLERLMRFMEDQSASMQRLHQRMDALESTSNSLLDRVRKIESDTSADVGGINRVSAESASPSVTRTSDSLESAPRPSTRAPSKAVN
ncbi:hypothetical protein CGC20_11020 [Leishmania donovani]|uniref:Uncharacterized protein n=3 Tax=Leishmania donovani species complex TaxID=38574 RepID=E9AHN3_LEIIN|nr:conserved hypothetical protein [Leishmania infantum JPCM5]TPP55610.1 hypothetical protein CGC20_11020 [Leishmania donovani]CAC9530691.1 hypothetical_protein_-_conserved [Leishmania infantum]CBZ08931.1 conserved hypothetical protein [Leishmania infantum JPCM5]SUZ45079.1 hypothetical_protein_-_conserved [Leishmania infantum]|eukprot:XP_003392734.1 conserved hypothetical protein [Leishmania infantum JPCM5]